MSPCLGHVLPRTLYVRTHLSNAKTSSDGSVGFGVKFLTLAEVSEMYTRLWIFNFGSCTVRGVDVLTAALCITTTDIFRIRFMTIRQLRQLQPRAQACAIVFPTIQSSTAMVMLASLRDGGIFRACTIQRRIAECVSSRRGLKRLLQVRTSSIECDVSVS